MPFTDTVFAVLPEFPKCTLYDNGSSDYIFGVTVKIPLAVGLGGVMRLYKSVTFKIKACMKLPVWLLV